MSFRINPIASGDELLDVLVNVIRGADRVEQQRAILDAAAENMNEVAAMLGWDEEVSAAVVRRVEPIHECELRVPFSGGEALFIRGVGFSTVQGESSWDRGIPMERKAGNVWMIKVAVSSSAVAFKFLKNDRDWENGDNHGLADMMRFAYLQ